MSKKNFTAEELRLIEELMKNEGLKAVEDYALKNWGLGQKPLRKLRSEISELSGAIERGKDARRKTRKKASSKLSKVNWDKIPVPVELDPNAALQKFKEEFEAKKRKRDLKELKEVYFV